MDQIDDEQSTAEKVKKRDGRKKLPHRKMHKKQSSHSPTDDAISEHQAERRLPIRTRNGGNEPSPSSSVVKKKYLKTREKNKGTQTKQENPKYYEGETGKQKLKDYKWDFLIDMEEEEVYNDHFWNKVEVITKIGVCICISTIVLATAVISKLCLILITSNILPPMNDTDVYWWHKTAGFSLTFKTQETNVQWIWALLLIISAPYLFTIISSGWQLLLGREKWKSEWTGFLRIMIQEIIHSIGICMMAFIILPSIDPIAGILVCFNVATIPGLFEIYQSFSVKSSPLSGALFIFAVILQLAGIGFACGCYASETKTETRILQIMSICLSPIFISSYWWENYFFFGKEIDGNKPKIGTQTGGHEKANDTENDVKNKQDNNKNKQDDDKTKQDDDQNKEDDAKNKEEIDKNGQDYDKNKQDNTTNKYNDINSKENYMNNQENDKNKQNDDKDKQDDHRNKENDDKSKASDDIKKQYDNKSTLDNKTNDDDKNKQDGDKNKQNDNENKLIYDRNQNDAAMNKPYDDKKKQDDNENQQINITNQNKDEKNKQDDDKNKQNKVKFLVGLRDLFRFRRTRTVRFYILVNVGKLLITLSFAIILFGLSYDCTHTLFGLYGNSTCENRFGKSILSVTTSLEHCHNYLPLIVAAVGIICSGACYKSVITGCKIVAQIPCVSLPLTLSSPIALAALIGILSRNIESCALSYPLLGTSSHKLLNHLSSSYYWMYIVSGICGYISLTIISCHIWTPGNKRLRKTKDLFERQLYCGLLLDQSIQLNLQTGINSEEQEDRKTLGSSEKDKPLSESPTRTKVYICATMWHEKKSEMMKLLDSILRLDKDHNKMVTMKNNEDLFDFEVHIFFDDAFETPQDQKEKKEKDQKENKGHDLRDKEQVLNNKGKEEVVLNAYVKSLIDVILERTAKLPDYKYRTKYGGRLEWKLPYESDMVVHLKNKNLIRHKKRWSQVMYMYYFLANNVINKIEEVSKGKVKSIKNVNSVLSSNSDLKESIGNTFILALDGDVDFQPEAVKYLLDRMRNKKELGAACGRIRPTGNGPIVWYQKFEYAVSHWLQKTAENVLGCVLCSPGCFSLFRGSALMNKRVMKAYTTDPTKSWHHVQYDQGEDRWLCTLLLQQGYKIEYVAASDAFTEAPEGFKEFLNQRRRWSPSTMANILDLIINYKKVVKNNKNISRMYIFYQAFLMLCTILTPGTILLMIVGALNTAFPVLSLWLALLITLLPVLVFIVICFNAKPRTQLKFAVIFSIGYAIMMIIVLVGLAVHVVKNGLCSVTTLFFIYVAGVFVISALLHPKETKCLLYGLLYFIAVPCTSIIMMLYALCNLNVITWGTRETTPEQETNQGIPRNQWQWDGLSQGTCSLFKCMCCCRQESNKQLITYKLDAIEKQLERLAKEKDEINDKAKYADTELQISYHNENRARELIHPDNEIEGLNNQTMKSVSTQTEKEKKPNNKALNEVSWINDPLLLYTKWGTLKDDEDKFWVQLIRRYLFPLDQKNEDKKMKHELTILRNKVCLFFILANALFVCIIFVLQQITAENRSLSIPLPCITGENRPSYVEPISLAFTLVFGIMLLLQFICMVLHRLETLIHIYARTEIFKETKDDERQNDKNATTKDYKRIQRIVLQDNDKAERKKRKQHSNRSIVKSNVVHPTTEPGNTQQNGASAE